MARRGRRQRMRRENTQPPREHVPAISQLTPEGLWRKWEAMHSARNSLPSTLDAIQQSSWVYSAVTLIADHVARTPSRVFRDGKPLDTHPILAFIDRPNAYNDQNTKTKMEFAYLMEILLHGNVMRLLGDLNGFRPTTMCVRPRWHFIPTHVLDALGRLVVTKWTINHLGAVGSFIPEDNIFHDALYNPLHDYEGLAPLEAALLSVANDSDINEYARRFFINDGSTGIVFTTDHPAFNQAKADEATKKWHEKHSGLKHAFDVKFVGFGLTPHNVGTPLDAKMLQILRSFTKEEIISGIFKVPLDAISAKDTGGDIVIGGPSGGTQASAREALLVNAVMPWAERYDEEFNRDVTWRFDASIEVRHDFSENPVLERRRLERAQAVVELIDRGLPFNEAIRWLRLDIMPQPHGNDWWVENNQVPARIIMEAGADAFKLAGAPAQDPVAPQRKKSRDQYIASILALAGQKSFQENVRTDADLRAAGAGLKNGQRIAALLRGGRQGRTPSCDAGGGADNGPSAVGSFAED